MKAYLYLLILVTSITSATAQNDYFFSPNSELDGDISSPEAFLGYPIGEFHTRHDRIVSYFQYLAEVSNRATFQEIGKTYEQRPQVVLTITSPENHSNLEQIRTEHLKLSDPSLPLPNIDEMPVVITLGYNVHGNEPSSSEAAMLMAYYLVASNAEEVERYRNEAIIHVDPVYNPDGRDRHTNWANMHRGDPKVADPLDREHNEVWPSGRVNHYWFDLNRDWLPLVHPESKARIEFYHRWLPNMVTDYHEMGTNATYFFEPTKPYGSENPLVPRSNYDGLNGIMAGYFSKALDDIGSLYFTKEVFDNFYPGYGSTYPDIHGGLGIVFEQASSRGHLQQSNTRAVKFSFTIRNHLRTSIATVEGSVKEKNTFLNHQREFFASGLQSGNTDAVKHYAFGEKNDPARLNAFVDLLLRHRIEVYSNPQATTIDGTSFEAGSSYLVPTNQRQYRMVKSVFEKVKSFHDSVFYDASAWSMALAYGIPHAEIRSSRFQLGSKVEEVPGEEITFNQAPYAYLFDWQDSRAPALLTKLLNSGVFVHTATKPFRANVNNQPRDFGYGSMMISVSDQEISQDKLHEIVREASLSTGLQVYGVGTGMSLGGIDLGSNNFQLVQQPKALMIVGEGIYLYEAGEIWHLLDSRVGLPITKIDKVDLLKADLTQYTAVVLVNGNYSDIPASWIEDLKTWIQSGGTLITQKSATTWAINNGLADTKLKTGKEAATSGRLDYATARDVRGSQRIGGSIYQVDLDITHPLGYGLASRKMAVYRNGTVFLEPSANEFSTVAQYTSSPWLSGFVSSENLEVIRNSAAIVVSGNGRGRAILFADNPNFRGTWYATSRLFINALFLGNMVRVP